MWMRIKSTKTRQVRKEDSIYLEFEYVEVESGSQLVQLLGLSSRYLYLVLTSAVPSPFTRACSILPVLVIYYESHRIIRLPHGQLESPSASTHLRPSDLTSRWRLHQ